MSRKMKSSALSWVEDVPSEWGIGKIKHIYSVTLGKMISPTQTDIDQTLENYLCAANIKWNGVDTSVHKQMWLNRSEKEQYLLEEGDVLIMEGGTAGTATIYHNEFAPCYIQNSVHKCHGKNLVANKFLYYWMHVVQNSGYVNTICNKATIQHYTKDKVKETPCVIVPEKEQQAIVRYLDSKCSAIDEAIERHKKIIEKLEEYRKAEISREMSACTKTIPAKRVFMIYAGATPKSGISEYWDGEINWITPADYKTEDHYITSSKRQITEEGYASCNTTIVPENSIIVSKRAPIGTVGIASVPLCTNQGCLSCVPYNNAYAEFYYYALIYKNEEMQVLGAGTTFQEISAVAFSNMKLPYADIDTQKKVASRLVAVDTMIQTYREKHLAVIEKLEEYRKSIIYNAVTGKIDCRKEATE